MKNDLGEDNMSDEEYQAAVDELTEQHQDPDEKRARVASKAARTAGSSAEKLLAEYNKLEEQRRELKRTPRAELDPGAFGELKTKIAVVKAKLAELGVIL